MAALAFLAALVNQFMLKPFHVNKTELTIDDSKAVYDSDTGNVRIENVVIVKEVTKTGH